MATTPWHHEQRSRSLGGEWLAVPADEAARRTVADLDLDDANWAPTTVPGHWRDTPGLEACDAVLYRHRFDATATPGRRTWLSIDGLCYQGDIWLDGAYLGDTEGYFIQHVFDVTHLMGLRREHLLAIEATCSTPSDRLHKTNITGTLQDADYLDGDINPGGIWRDVRLEETGDIRIDDLRLLVLEADADRAILQFRAALDSSATHRAIVRTAVDPASDHSGDGVAATHEQELVLARGRNEVEWHVAVEQPDLWWPHSLGDQHLYDVRIEVQADGETSHVRKRRTGLRTVELRNWIASVNGERLYLKGTNLGPASIDLASTTEADHRRDLATAKAAGLDLVRVHGHVAGPALYREADRTGLLVWQDFPLHRGHARSVARQTTRQVERLVDQLGHHPSLLLWCAHNEPEVDAAVASSGASTVARLLRRQLPSWNRTVLDRSTRRAFAAADPTRASIAHSGVLPHPPQLDGTDVHLSFGWRHGDVADVGRLARRVPRLVRFVGEFGAQALPHDVDLAAGVGAERFPVLDEEAASRLGADLELLQLHSPREAAADWHEWVEHTQRHQATVIRHTIESLRVLKYRPNGGYCQLLFADAMPYISHAVLDHLRRPKAGYVALAAASRPVLPVADLHRSTLFAGIHRVSVHAVSDLREPVENAVITAEWTAPGIETRRWVRTGDLDADSVTRVAKLRLAAPEPGPAQLRLTIAADGRRIENDYPVEII